jgi:hypothetical protein
MPYDYSRNSLNNFVQKQGGTLENLGASPTYTGAPAMSGTPPGGQQQQPSPNNFGAYSPGSPMPQPYQINPGMPQRPGQMQQAPTGNYNMQNLGQQMNPRIMSMLQNRQNRQMPQRGQMPQNNGDPRRSAALLDPRRRAQVMEMIKRRQGSQPMRGNLSRLGMRR